MTHRSLALALLGTACLSTEALAREIYVSNEKGNSVSIVDGDKLELVKQVEVGERPRGIVLSPDGKFLYIAASDDDTVQIMDTASLEIVGDLPSGLSTMPRGRLPTGIVAFTSSASPSITVIELPFSFET